MGVIEFIGLITHGGQALDHFGLTNTDCPHWTVRIGQSNSNWSVHIGPTNLPRTIAQNLCDSRITTD